MNEHDAMIDRAIAGAVDQRPLTLAEGKVLATALITLLSALVNDEPVGREVAKEIHSQLLKIVASN